MARQGPVTLDATIERVSLPSREPVGQSHGRGRGVAR